MMAVVAVVVVVDMDLVSVAPSWVLHRLHTELRPIGSLSPLAVAMMAVMAVVVVVDMDLVSVA